MDRCSDGPSDALVSLSRPRRAPDERKRRALLIVSPFCSPNYTYPAPAYLARYLRRQGFDVAQADLNLELMLRMFCKSGLDRIFAAGEASVARLSPAGYRVWSMRARYISTVESVIRFLQGRDASLAYRLIQPAFLPRGENFDFNKGFDAYDGAGNTIAVHDRAKFVGTLFLYDIAGFIREAIFPYFQITLVDRYYDSYVHACTTFDQMRGELEREPTVIDEMLGECLDGHLRTFAPDLVGVTVPFARNLYWALRCGIRTREWNPEAKVAVGGGFFNTSMRSPNEVRLFDYVDYVTLDDGERPIQCILEQMQGAREASELRRTFYRAQGEIRYSDGCKEPDPGHADSGAPDYTGYRICDYFSSLETINILQRVRSDGWWNKMTMAHGCYWKKCSFCDIHLSYVGDYDTASAVNLADKVEEIIAQTGHTGFHFVDEAMPPKIMRDFAIEILRRDLHISWHGMMRFDKTFTPEVCKLLAAAGLIGIMGGLEVASDRLLDLMKKGTSIQQVATVAKNFKDAGIKVHAYIMYGFPTQTAQETIDALDVVRQMFKHGLVTSASWAKFAVTPHSPIGRNPEEYKIQLLSVPEGSFVEQVIPHLDPTGADHEQYTAGLMEALKYYGLGFHHDTPVEGWFKFPVPTVSHDRDLVGKHLEAHAAATTRVEKGARDRRALWLGTPPTLRLLPTVPGQEQQAELVLHETLGDHAIAMPASWATWLLSALARAQPDAGAPTTLKDLEASWNQALRAGAPATALEPAPTFEELLDSSVWQTLQERGLILTQQQQRVIWMGTAPTLRFLSQGQPGQEPRAELVLHEEGAEVAVGMPMRWATWFADVLERSQPDAREALELGELKRWWSEAVRYAQANAASVAFKDFLRSSVWRAMRQRGLALV